MTWSEDARTFIAALAATNRQFSADEVIAMLAKHSKADPPADGKAMGAMMANAIRHGVIAPQAAWQQSVRRNDRPLKLFVGTGKVYPTIKITNRHVLWAIQAINDVAQERSRQIVAELRRAKEATA